MQDWQEFTVKIIDELLEDGSDPDALHTIEHHFSAERFDILEKAAVVAFKQGYDVGEPEEFELEDGSRVLGFDIVIEQPLEEELMLEDVNKLVQFAKETNIEYDGWGTYFEDGTNQQ
ncbi:ribonuclease E inhibitor RraB [Flocculibacter collagenilyticus]|uniref:ribonuclease E inhibitor RraB n=1 Tax=Flocculibacter collagenilyticus TaxID=2744479 RepID=UPI0018F47A02|nr:ribonuclease E inhibitor RraB [Flocculibacter collagenilyticus]